MQRLRTDGVPSRLALSDGCRRADEQVSGIRASLSGGPLEVVDLGEVVRAVRVRRWRELEASGLRVHGLTGPLWAWAERRVMVRVLGELVDNAVRHATGARNMWLRGFLDGRWAHLVIRDDGPGWPKPGPSRLGGLRSCRAALRDLGGRLDLVPSESGAELVLTLLAAAAPADVEPL